MLPRATSPVPSKTAPTVTAISGALVPNATTVKPMTRGETPNDRDNLEAPLTSALAPRSNNSNPMAKKKTVTNILNPADNSQLLNKNGVKPRREQSPKN